MAGARSMGVHSMQVDGCPCDVQGRWVSMRWLASAAHVRCGWRMAYSTWRFSVADSVVLTASHRNLQGQAPRVQDHDLRYGAVLGVMLLCICWFAHAGESIVTEDKSTRSWSSWNHDVLGIDVFRSRDARRSVGERRRRDQRHREGFVPGLSCIDYRGARCECAGFSSLDSKEDKRLNVRTNRAGG